MNDQNDERPEPRPSLRLQQIVVGVDLSPESLHALDLAVAVGAPHGAALRIVHVHPRPLTLGVSPLAAAEYEKAQSEIDDAVKSEAAKRLDQYEGRWDFVTRHGHAGHEILAEAEERDVDLIVVGHRSHGPLHDALLGSVATSAVHHSRRSILVAIAPSAPT